MDRTPSPWEPGHIVAGRYRLLHVIGAGNVGRVFAAEALATGDRVALKGLHDKYALEPRMRIRFGREVLALHSLRHPHIVGYYDHGVDAERRPYLVMELVTGQPGTALVGHEPRLSYRVVLGLVHKLCSALSYAHDHGIIHRDLKWANLVLPTPDPTSAEDLLTLKLIDFGVLKFAVNSALEDGRRLTDTGVVVGTPYYASPEQILGKDLDARSDVYALAVMLYELLTGQRPFQGKSHMKVVLAHLHEAPVPPERVGGPYPISEGLSRALLAALAKEPAERTPSMRAFYKSVAAPLAELAQAEEAGALAAS